MRVGLVATAPSSHASLIEATLQLGGKEAWSQVRSILSTESPDQLENGEWSLADETKIEIPSESLAAADDVIGDHVTFVSQCLDMTPQSTVIISNGRVGLLHTFYTITFQQLPSFKLSCAGGRSSGC